MSRFLSFLSTVILAFSSVDSLHGGSLVSGFEGLQVVPDVELDQIRGGFEVNNGGLPLSFYFGIERATFVNGQLVSTTTLALPALPSALSAAGTAVENFNSIAVIQNGPGNIASLPSVHDLPASVMSLIQNTLDNQVISNVTVVNASVTTRDYLRSLDIQHALNHMTFSALP